MPNTPQRIPTREEVKTWVLEVTNSAGNPPRTQEEKDEFCKFALACFDWMSTPEALAMVEDIHMELYSPKSWIIKQHALANGLDLVDFRLAQIDPDDLKGFPQQIKDDFNVYGTVTGRMANTMTPPVDWRDRDNYYKTKEPCQICGSTWQTGMEPRFCYTVCEEHSKLSPVEISHKVLR